MGCPSNSYYRMCYEAERILNEKRECDYSLSRQEVEKYLKEREHNEYFFFNCGIAAANVIHDISENEGNDAFNAAIGGFAMFQELIEVPMKESGK